MYRAFRGRKRVEVSTAEESSAVSVFVVGWVVWRRLSERGTSSVYPSAWQFASSSSRARKPRF